MWCIKIYEVVMPANATPAQAVPVYSRRGLMPQRPTGKLGPCDQAVIGPLPSALWCYCWFFFLFFFIFLISYDVISNILCYSQCHRCQTNWHFFDVFDLETVQKCDHTFSAESNSHFFDVFDLWSSEVWSHFLCSENVKAHLLRDSSSVSDVLS